jgi:hypothetical protein
MKKKILFPILAGIFISLPVLASDQRSSIKNAAHKLDKAASHFSNVVQNRQGYSHLSRASQALASKARHFHESLHDGDSRRHLIRDYNRLAERYTHLADDYASAHNAHHSHRIEGEFAELTHVYCELKYAMRGSSHHYQHPHDANSCQQHRQRWH